MPESFGNYEAGDLLDMLRDNNYLPIVVAGRLVQLVKARTVTGEQQMATLCTVELGKHRPYYSNHHAVQVSYYGLSPKAIDSLDIMRNNDGSAAPG